MHEPFDDGPDTLTIRHTDGKDFPADEVYITGREEGNEAFENVNSYYEPDGNVLKQWSTLDSDSSPTDGIGGAEIRIDFAPDISSRGNAFTVFVVWKINSKQQVIGEWVYSEPYDT